MATILPFPIKKVVPVNGLSEHECDAIQAEAYDLMLQGRATGVSIHGEGQYMCVFDSDGEPYSIGRKNGRNWFPARACWGASTTACWRKALSPEN